MALAPRSRTFFNNEPACPAMDVRADVASALGGGGRAGGARPAGDAPLSAADGGGRAGIEFCPPDTPLDGVGVAR